MKKLLAVGLSVGLLIGGCAKADAPNVTEVVEAKVVTADADEDGYIIVENVKDSADTIAIEKEDFELGDIVTIEFDGDQVVSVR